MKARYTLVILVIVSVAILGTLPGYGSGADVEKKKIGLEMLVDEYISCCEAKAAMRSSRSENIRRSAVRACMKADFYKHFREELVREMLAKDIEPKPYKVRRFLNEKFTETLGNKVYSAK